MYAFEKHFRKYHRVFRRFRDGSPETISYLATPNFARDTHGTFEVRYLKYFLYNIFNVSKLFEVFNVFICFKFLVLQLGCLVEFTSKLYNL